MSTVYLHVGAMKSGTTYLQKVLQHNRDQLEHRGMLFPGLRWSDQVTAAEDLIGRRPDGKPASPGAWEALVDEVMAHEGPAIISMETLSSARKAQARRAAQSFAPRRVRVIVTARDVGRVIPAQWQEWVQNGGTVSFSTFLRTSSAVRVSVAPVARRLWWSQNIARILRTWQPYVDASDLVLVTVPPDGSDRSLLWRRFCEAVELDDADAYDLQVASNESLGAVSAELMRRVNRAAKRRHEPWQARSRVKHRLGKRVLASRKSREPKLVIPDRYRDFAVNTSQRMVGDIEKVGPQVVGDLDELRVTAAALPRADGGVSSLSDPERLGVEQLLEAALDGLLGLSTDPVATSADG